MASTDLSPALRTEERIRTEMAIARGELVDSLVAIQERLREASNWRGVIRRRPIASLLVAGGIGILIARLELARRKGKR